MRHIQHQRLWGATALACAAITVACSASMLLSTRHTQASIDRLILHGPGGHSASIMHHVSLGRRDGRSREVEVSGSASTAQLIQAIEAFSAGDEDPQGWKVTEWTIAGGTTIKVSTPPKPDETMAEHCARHDAFVEELQDRFPPV